MGDNTGGRALILPSIRFHVLESGFLSDALAHRHVTFHLIKCIFSRKNVLKNLNTGRYMLLNT
jgi:hypothetical protein